MNSKIKKFKELTQIRRDLRSAYSAIEEIELDIKNKNLSCKIRRNFWFSIIIFLKWYKGGNNGFGISLEIDYPNLDYQKIDRLKDYRDKNIAHKDLNSKFILDKDIFKINDSISKIESTFEETLAPDKNLLKNLKNNIEISHNQIDLDMLNIEKDILKMITSGEIEKEEVESILNS